MLALFSNIDFSEMIVIAAVALLVFGKRLPEVAVRAAAQLARARRSLNDMWRQTGLEDELRRVRREIDSEQRRIETSIPDWRKELPKWNGEMEARGQGSAAAGPGETAATPEEQANAPYQKRPMTPTPKEERARQGKAPGAPPGWVEEDEPAKVVSMDETPAQEAAPAAPTQVEKGPEAPG